MKSRFSICAFFLVALIPSEICARFALGFDADYISQTNYQSNTSGVSASSPATGFGVIPSLRYEFPVVAPISAGVGAYAGYGAVSPDLGNSVTSDTITGIAYGGDLWLIFEPGLRIKPYARVMLGFVSLEEKVTLTSPVGYYSLTVGSSGFQYNFLAGIRIPVLPLIELYVQGGYAGVANQTQTLKSFTLNGAAVTNVTTNPANYYSAGFLVGGGFMLLF